jgi:hypothetical protein
MSLFILKMKQNINAQRQKNIFFLMLKQVVYKERLCLRINTTNALLFENQYESATVHTVLRADVLMVSLFHFECRIYLESRLRFSKHTSICT